VSPRDNCIHGGHSLHVHPTMRRRCLGFDVKSQTVLGSPRTVVLPEIFRTICSLQGPFAFFPYGQTASGEPRPQNPVVPRFSGFVADWPRPLARVPSPRSSQGLTRICDRRQRCRVHPDASRHAKREPRKPYRHRSFTRSPCRLSLTKPPRRAPRPGPTSPCSAASPAPLR